MARIKTMQNGVPCIYDTVTGEVTFINTNGNDKKANQMTQPKTSNNKPPVNKDQSVKPKESNKTPDNYQPARPVVQCKDTDDFITKCKISYDAHTMSSNVVASCIVGKIRAIYFTTVKKPSSYDLEILNYMDKILFDNLTKIIEGIVTYGSGCIDKSLVKTFIGDAINAVEFQTDIESTYKIIDRLYEEF